MAYSCSEPLFPSVTLTMFVPCLENMHVAFCTSFVVVFNHAVITGSTVILVHIPSSLINGSSLHRHWCTQFPAWGKVSEGAGRLLSPALTCCQATRWTSSDIMAPHDTGVHAFCLMLLLRDHNHASCTKGRRRQQLVLFYSLSDRTLPSPRWALRSIGPFASRASLKLTLLKSVQKVCGGGWPA